MIKNIFFAFLILVGDVAYGATEKTQNVDQQWKTFIGERKQLLEKLTQLGKKQDEYSRLAVEKQEKISTSRQKTSQYIHLLIRLGRVNPLRFLVDLKSSQYSIRGIILTRTFASALNTYMRQVQADVTELQAISSDLHSQRQDYQTLLQEIELQKMSAKTASEKIVNALKQKEEERLAGETNLQSLLEESRSVLSKKEENPKPAAPKKNLPFTLLEQPVAGEKVDDPTLQKKFSPQGTGILIRTKKNADVRAPAKGIVVFKGPFRSQGEILILDHGENTHTVYMGIDKINVDMGQFVYAGDKLGVTAHYGKKDPLLYLELRKNGKPVDITPYLAE